MTKVKICGLTRENDARLAVELGAWALGMIMWPNSPRYVEPQAAADIADATRRSAEIAGVFVNQPLDEVVALTNEIGLMIVQLHGDEGQKFAHAVVQKTDAKVVKAFRVKGRDVLAEMGKFVDVDYHLLDSYKAGVPGGTGEVFDWSFLAANPRRGDIPLILSGGLTPENVTTAIETVRPYAVDVSSGVESEPGIKDEAKLRAFFAAVDAVTLTGLEKPDGPLTGAEEEVLTLKWVRRQAEIEAAEKARAEARRVAREAAAAEPEPEADAEEPETEAEAPETEAEALETEAEALEKEAAENA